MNYSTTNQQKMNVLVKIFLINIICIHFLFAQKSPKQLAESVVNRIIEEAKLETTQGQNKIFQEKTWLIDFEQVEGFKIGQIQTATTSINYKEKPSENIKLGISASMGDLEILIDSKIVFKKSIENVQEINRLDYDFIRFSETILLPNFESKSKLEVRFKPKSNNAKVYLGFFDAKSGMSVLNPYFDKTSENDTDTFVYDEGRKQIPVMITTAKGNVEFSDWRYFTGTFLTAIDDVSKIYQLPEYQLFIQKHIAFFLNNYPKIKEEREKFGLREGLFTLYNRHKLLDDFAPQTTVFLTQNDYFKNDLAYQNIIKKATNTIINEVPRLQDGTFIRITPDSMTVQADDLFMGGLFLIRASKILKRPDLLEDAAKQTLNFHKYLFDSNSGLYRHAFFSRNQMLSSTCWGRGMGWMMMVYVELLENLPKNHPKREEILSNFQKMSGNLLKYQNQDGRWHEVLNDKNSYLETSATALFLRAFAVGIKNNWLDKKTFTQPTWLAWEALQTQIQEDGQVKNIVRGTPVLESDEAYNKQKTRLNDPRGLGAVLWAILAIDNLNKK
jgi:rhamnogalacturonyl hydrolase YesR